MSVLTPEDIEVMQGVGLVRAIIRDVSRQTGIGRAAILSPCREVHIVRARDAVCFIARRMGMTYPKIARELNRDHTTIMAAVRREAARRQGAAA